MIGLDLIALITLGFKYFKLIREEALRVREYFYLIKSMLLFFFYYFKF